MENLTASSMLQVQLKDASMAFESSLRSELTDYNTTIKDYELRINNSLDLQYQATYLVSITTRMLHLNKENIKGSDALKYRKENDNLQTWLEYYRGHVYTFSSRAKVLSDLLKSKLLSNPDVKFQQ